MAEVVIVLDPETQRNGVRQGVVDFHSDRPIIGEAIADFHNDFPPGREAIRDFIKARGGVLGGIMRKWNPPLEGEQPAGISRELHSREKPGVFAILHMRFCEFPGKTKPENP